MSITLSPGMSGIALDLFVKAGPVLFDPSPIPTYSIVDASSFFQGSGNGYRINIGHYDARNFTVPSSGNLGTWTVTWTVGSTTKIETFNVLAPSLTLGDSAVNPIDRMVDNIRIDIGDYYGQIFAESLIHRYIIKAVMRLNRELGIASGKVRPTGITPGGLGAPMRMPAIVLDLDSRTITPNNDEIKDIIILQSEVLITHAEMATLRRASSAGAGADGATLIASASGIATSSDGIMIRNADGVTISTEKRFGTWAATKVGLFLAEAARREAELERAIKQLKYSFSANYGKVIY